MPDFVKARWVPGYTVQIPGRGTLGPGDIADIPLAEARDSEHWDPVEKLPAGKADHEHPVDFDAMSVEDLAALAAGHELEVDGTGSNGNVIKADLVKALEDAHPLEGTDA